MFSHHGHIFFPKEICFNKAHYMTEEMDSVLNVFLIRSKLDGL